MNTLKPSYYELYPSRTPTGPKAHLEITDHEVTASSPALAFMIGWAESKVRMKAVQYGYHIRNLPRGTRNTTFVTERPTDEQRKAAKTNPTLS